MFYKHMIGIQIYVQGGG